MNEKFLINHIFAFYYHPSPTILKQRGSSVMSFSQNCLVRMRNRSQTLHRCSVAVDVRHSEKVKVGIYIYI